MAPGNLQAGFHELPAAAEPGQDCTAVAKFWMITADLENATPIPSLWATLASGCCLIDGCLTGGWVADSCQVDAG